MLNNAIVANIPVKLLSPVSTLTVTSPLFTGVLTALSTGVFTLASKLLIAFSNVAFALSICS